MAYHQRNGWQSCQACCRAVVKGMDMKPTDTSPEAVERLADFLEHEGDGLYATTTAPATIRALSDALKASREAHCAIAEHILERGKFPADGPVDTKGIFADSQRARLGIDAALRDVEGGGG